jgi:hypothetical protein
MGIDGSQTHMSVRSFWTYGKLVMMLLFLIVSHPPLGRWSRFIYLSKGNPIIINL